MVDQQTQQQPACSINRVPDEFSAYLRERDGRGGCSARTAAGV